MVEEQGPGWAEEVRRLRATPSGGRRRPRLHVGLPGGARESFADPGGLDPTLRAEVVDRLVTATGDEAAVLWLTRPGHPSVHDDDLAWLAAVLATVPGGTLRVVTPHGWLNPADGRHGGPGP